MDPAASPDESAAPTNSRSLTKITKPRSTVPRPPDVRRPAGRVSASPNAPTSSSSRPKPASTPKIPRQLMIALS